MTYGDESYVCSTSHTSTSSVDASKSTELAAKGNDGSSATVFAPPQGRFTLTTGVPVPTSTVSAATSVIYTPATGNLVPIWNGTADVITTFTEVSQTLADATQSLSAGAASQVYDAFA